MAFKDRQYWVARGYVKYRNKIYTKRLSKHDTKEEAERAEREWVFYEKSAIRERLIREVEEDVLVKDRLLTQWGGGFLEWS